MSLFGLLSSRSSKAAKRLAEQIGILRQFPLLDPVWYRQTYQDLRDSPVDVARHYIEHGAAEGRNPHPLFDTKFYVEHNPNVAISRINPLVYYILNGAKECYDPHPNFDTKYYLEQIGNLQCKQVNALLHYLTEGYKIGLKPNRQPDQIILESSTNRVVYPPRTSGQRHNSANIPGTELTQISRQQSSELDTVKIARGDVAGSTSEDSIIKDMAVAHNHFDRKFYLAVNVDVARAKIDPLRHFVAMGWKEGRDPSPLFSTSGYLDQNPDVAAAGINPFIHYLNMGKTEGRTAMPNFGFRYRLLRSPPSLKEKIAESRKFIVQSSSSTQTLVNSLRALTRSGGQNLYCSVSHDDYAQNFGGIQLCLSIEANAMAKRGIDHVHLFPARPLPVVEIDKNLHLIGVRVNGEPAGVFTFETIAGVLKNHSLARRCMFGVHSLIGHNVEHISVLIKLLSAEHGVYWIHDYSSICSSYTLLRNDVQFCGAPKITSQACMVCRYGDLRSVQYGVHKAFLKPGMVKVVAPSHTAADLWRSAYQWKEGIVIQPHCTLSPTQVRTPPETVQRRPLRIAFLGMPISHKGWWVFRDLIIRYCGDERYEFHHFGSDTEPGLPLNFHRITVTHENMDGMISLIRDHEIDVALIWSLWPETFCFTAHEALAGGAAIITHVDSGNVRAIVETLRSGFILESEKDLMAGLDNGRFLSLHRDHRLVSFYSRTFSGMSNDLLFK